MMLQTAQYTVPCLHCHKAPHPSLAIFQDMLGIRMQSPACCSMGHQGPSPYCTVPEGVWHTAQHGIQPQHSDLLTHLTSCNITPPLTSSPTACSGSLLWIWCGVVPAWMLLQIV